jgi:hypothetical protein
MLSKLMKSLLILSLALAASRSARAGKEGAGQG